MPRYHTVTEMVHRPSNLAHVQRVSGLIFFLPNDMKFDREKALRLAWHHNGPEIVTGDYPTLEKRAISSAQKKIAV